MKKFPNLPSSFSSCRGSDIDSSRYSIDFSTNRVKHNIAYQPNHRHIRENRKKEQLMEEKFTEIERENRILLEKIHKIMNSNNINVKPKGQKSLNYSQRVQKQRQISRENFKMLQRLQSKKSFYDFNEFFSIKRKTSKPGPLLESVKSVKLSPIQFDVKQLVYKKNVFIENKVFQIEITKGVNRIRIVAYECEEKECFSLELSKNEALTLMGGVEDWDKLINLLHIDGNDLALWQDDITSLNFSV